ncbi:MAG: winged helix-turn-helix domain-containing protein [Nitrososphaerota archaeon]
MTHRTQITIVADLLKAVKEEDHVGGARISSLLRKANIPYSRLVDITERMVSNQLLLKIPAERGSLYKLGPKGLEFLENFERFERFAKAYGLRL